MTAISFRKYSGADCAACMRIFDANCPEFFACNEREEYAGFLEREPGNYEVCEADGKLVGAFGLFVAGESIKSLNWILLDPQSQGIGLGSKILQRVIQLGLISKTKVLKIAASHKSAPFFARFGALPISKTKDGWGSGMDRVDMEILL